MISASLLPVALLLSLFLTWRLRRYALARHLLDVPNVRSSHTSPTPRGGGMAIVLAFLGCLTVAWLLGAVALQPYVAVSGAGAFVGIVGFLDDHYRLSRRLRLLAHIAAAAWLLGWLGGAPAIGPAFSGIDALLLTTLVAAFFVVWMVNLYNFMDGIDALASIEAITVCFGGAILYWLVLPGDLHWLPPAVLLAAVCGFLAFNYPPARIFMGDAGSGFLGVTLAAFALQAGIVRPALWPAWLILLGVFVVDASVTLLRRMLAGGRKYLEGHRTHAYQHAARRLRAHAPVSLAVGAINLFWLLPLASLVSLGHLSGLVGVVIAYLPLVLLAFRLRAGVDESPEP